MVAELTAYEQQTAMTPENARLVVNQLSKYLHERKDKVVIKGKQYLEFKDWQFIGINFGITASVDCVEELNTIEKERVKFVGYKAHAKAIKNGQVLSNAIAECTRLEPTWTEKPRFQILSMAQTRACAKVLRNILSWVFAQPEFESFETSESAEEITLRRGYGNRTNQNQIKPLSATNGVQP